MAIRPVKNEISSEIRHIGPALRTTDNLVRIDRLQGYKLKESQTIQLFHGVASMLGDLHEKEIVHGNVCPENILCAKLKVLNESKWDIQLLNGGRAKFSTKEEDVYELGKVLYKFLAGCEPIEDRGAFFAGLRNRTDAALSKKWGMDAWCWEVLEMAAAPKVTERGSAGEIRDALFEHFLEMKKMDRPVVGIFGNPLVAIEKKDISSERRIGEGGFAVASLVEAKIDGKTVNVVRKRPRLWGIEELDRKMINAIYNEYEKMVKAYNPYLVRAFHLGEEKVIEGGREMTVPYIDMEYVEGKELSQYIGDDRTGKMSTREILETAIQIIEGVAEFHDQGYVHGDLKPDNMIVRNDGRPKVLDYGIADWSLPTMIYDVVRGTRQWMAPEQLAGAREKRGDIWSLGLIISALLKKEPIINTDEAQDANQLIDIFRGAEDKVDNIYIAGLDREQEGQLRDILKKMLAFKPEDRYQDAHEITRDLEILLAT